MQPYYDLSRIRYPLQERSMLNSSHRCSPDESTPKPDIFCRLRPRLEIALLCLKKKNIAKPDRGCDCRADILTLPPYRAFATAEHAA